jgi:hypothetical protein
MISAETNNLVFFNVMGVEKRNISGFPINATGRNWAGLTRIRLIVERVSAYGAS